MTELEMKSMLEKMHEDVEGKKRNVWTPPSNEEGTYTIRFLPPLKKLNETVFYFRYRVSFLNGTPFLSLNQSLVDSTGNEHFAEPCPLEQESRKLFGMSEKGSPEWKLASSIAPRYRYIYRVVLRGSEDETQPVFYESGTAVFNKLFTILTSSESQFGNIVDAVNGRDFRLIKSGTGRQSRYDNSMPSLESTPVFSDKNKMKAVFENAQEMHYNTLISFPTREQVQEAVDRALGRTNAKMTIGIPVEQNPLHGQVNSSPVNSSTKITPKPPVEEDDDDELQDLVNSFTA